MDSKPKVSPRYSIETTSTFAEALISQKKRFEEEQKRLKSEKVRPKLEDICPLMMSSIKLLESGNQKALDYISHRIHTNNTPEVVREMSQWTDDHNLNLVHYAMLYKQQAILKYLLIDSGVWPVDHQPETCPYAHLAAYLGSLSALRVLLEHRPADFLKYIKEDIVLPDDLIQRVRGLWKLSSPSKEVHDSRKSVIDFRAEFSRCILCKIDVPMHDNDDFLKAYMSECQFEDDSSTSEMSTSQSKFIWFQSKPISNRPKGELRQKIQPPRNKGTLKLPNVETRQKSEHSLIQKSKSKSMAKQDLSFKGDSVKHPVEKSTPGQESFMGLSKLTGKTPLSIACECGHSRIVCEIIKSVYLNEIPKSIIETFGNLTMAAKVFSPEAIVAFLERGNDITYADYQEAVLISIQNFNPDCLLVLLSKRPASFKSFETINMYHLLYTQTVDVTDYQYQMIVIMTQVLISCGQNVNNFSEPNTFPLYSLMSTYMFHGSKLRLLIGFQCLKLLLEAGANPFFDETKSRTKSKWKFTGISQLKTITRQPYTSVFNCIFENAHMVLSLEKTNTECLRCVVNGTIINVLRMTTVRQPIPSNVLSQYMEISFHLGVEGLVFNHLFKHGANPSEKHLGRYPINIYFDTLFAFLKDFQRINDHDHYKRELHILIETLCCVMESDKFKEAVSILLKQYITGIPLQAVAITKYFLYLADNLSKDRYLHDSSIASVTSSGKYKSIPKRSF